jgi:peptidoglycan/LPS O-acetylase OafA/YrhL
MEPIIVFVYFPFLIALGAGTRTGPFWSDVCKKLGDLSYPLYMVHYPFLWLFLSYIQAEKPALSQLTFIIPVLAISLIIFSYLVMIYVDVPIRRYLMRLQTQQR